MGETSPVAGPAASLQPPLDERLFVKWLESQPEETQSK
jgi:hypothetical protein